MTICFQQLLISEGAHHRPVFTSTISTFSPVCANFVLIACYIQRTSIFDACICLLTHVEACCFAFTCAGELFGGRGEEQFVGHVAGPSTTGNAGLLVAALHPV